MLLVYKELRELCASFLKGFFRCLNSGWCVVWFKSLLTSMCLILMVLDLDFISFIWLLMLIRLKYLIVFWLRLLKVIWCCHSTMLLYKFHFTPLLFWQFNMFIIIYYFFNCCCFIFFLIICIKRSGNKFCVFRNWLGLDACHTTTIHILKHTLIRFKHFWLFFLLSSLLRLL